MFTTKALAQITVESVGVDPTGLGNISSIAGVFFWGLNFLRWIGWAGVVLGTLYTIVTIIYNLWTAEDASFSYEIVVKSIRKTIVISVLGLVLVSIAGVISIIAGLFGASVPFKLPFTP